MYRRRRLSIRRLIKDLGGVSKVSLDCGWHRTQPYRWISHNQMTIARLERIINTYELTDLSHWLVTEKEFLKDEREAGQEGLEARIASAKRRRLD